MDRLGLGTFAELVDPGSLLKIALVLAVIMTLNVFVARFVMIVRRVPWEAQHPILFLLVVSYLALIIPPFGFLAVGYTWYRVWTV
jgi:hypothetical protein